jgi:release factor glutamine methyltransferase
MQEATNPINPTTLQHILRAIGEPPREVYRPSDDTFLMLEAISDFPFKGKETLDMGTGSGILGLFAVIRGANVTMADIDEPSVRHATSAAESLGVNVNSITSDLFSNIHGQFDVILFNPPYLPSTTTTDIATDGGPKGVAVTDRFLGELPEHLKKNGTAFLLVSTQNDPTSLSCRHQQFSFILVKRRALFFEELQVFRLGFRDAPGQ